MAIKILTKLDFYAYFIQKYVYIEKILIKLNACTFWQNRKTFLVNKMKSGKKLAISWKQKIHSKVLYNIKYLKVKKNIKTKEDLYKIPNII